MPDEVAALVERLALLELGLADEKHARAAAAAEADTLRQAVGRLSRELSDGLGRVDARLEAMAGEQQQVVAGLDAARAWLADLTQHVAAAQKEAHGWVVAEQEARTVLEQSLLALRERLPEEGDAANRRFREAALRTEVLALGHVVEDLSAAVFPSREAPFTDTPGDIP